MKIMRGFLLILFQLFYLLQPGLYSQTDTTRTEKEGKSGFNFGVVPVVAYDSDIGFKYGGLVNVFHYGDGSAYPMYNHSLYLEWSRTTRGSGINQITYDSEKLIPGTRVYGEFSYLTENALDFYGFNGYQTSYHPEFEDKNSPSYISRLFYRAERELWRLNTDFHVNLSGRKHRLFLGYAYFKNAYRPIDTDDFNSGLPADKHVPDTSSLFENMIDFGYLPYEERNGGMVNYLKIGYIFDTRDNEPNPNKGLWEEVIFLTAPPVLNSDHKYIKMVLTHRHYIPIIMGRLTFAYRISYQDKLVGDMPFYMLSYVYQSSLTREGLGGSKTIRGVLRNRVLGEDLLYSNIELRYKMAKFSMLNQHFYVASSLFFDTGRVTGFYKFQKPVNVPQRVKDMVGVNRENFHSGYGFGLYGSMNENFIVAINYGRTLDERDGNSGLYINMGFLF